MNEKDIREYSRTLLDAFNDLTGNSINPNLDDFLKIRERSIFELNSFQKNNQKTNKIVDDNKVVNVPSNQKTNVDENVNKIDNFKENKESSLTPTSESASKVENEKQENIKEKQIDISNNKKLTQTPTPTPIPTSKVKDKPTLIQNKNQNVDNKQPKVDNTINQESKNVEKNEISNNNVIAGEIEETVELDFGDDGDNFEVSEKKSAFDILKGLKDQWN
jgi:hypothetical protein